MKKLLLPFVLISLLLLSACSADAADTLNGKTFDLSSISYDPTIKDSEGLHDVLTLSFDNDTVTTIKSNEFTGSYTLEDEDLNIALEHKGQVLELLFTNFKESNYDDASYEAVLENYSIEGVNDKDLNYLSDVASKMELESTFYFVEK